MNSKIHQAIDGEEKKKDASMEGAKNGQCGGAFRGVKTLAMALLLAGCGLALTGCVGGYVEPDYSPYYGDYGYGGAPFPFVGGGDIIVGGYHHHGYYGGHHFGHDFHGGGSFHGGGFHGGGGHGGHR